MSDRLMQVASSAADFLPSAKVIILTYGTAYAFRHKASNTLVANCHKLPAAQFEKVLLSPAHIVESFEVLYKVVKAIQPEVRWVLTVSPVRHIRETLPLNSVSKSTLRLACHQLAQQFAEVDYFPAYEILMDDLRDYRFYAADMIHPSETARSYIWGKFGNRYFDSPTQHLVQRLSAIQKSLAHRPFHPASPSHQQFLHETLRQLEELKGLVNVDTEIKHIKSRIHPS